jgi:aryl-alcohol dehydrogenase-like predicted oxidoreductase
VKMPYRKLGSSGMHVSILCLGTMMFGGRTDAKTSNEIVAHAYDTGVNFIDTADAYTDGASESIVGAAVREHRDRWIVATKVGNPLPFIAGRPHTGGLSRRWIMQGCDGSLARLGLDHIDIYYLHLDDPRTPIAETVAAMGDLMRSGKIRYFGLSNYRGWRIAEVMRWCEKLSVPQPIVCQPYYNLLNRMPEVEVLPACDHFGLGVVPYSPVARGVLTGKYAQGQVPQDSRAAQKDKRLMETEFRAESFAIAARLKEHAERTGRTPTQLALAWLWANQLVTSVIAGPRTFEQWTDYVNAIGTPWTQEDEALVDALVAPGHPSTPGYNDPAYPFYGRRTS